MNKDYFFLQGKLQVHFENNILKKIETKRECTLNHVNALLNE